MKKNNTDHNSLIYLLIFAVAFFAIIVISITFKVIKLVQESNFTTDVFNIALVGKDTYIVHINRRDNTFNYLTVPGSNKRLNEQKNFSYSFFYGVPIHGVIVDTKKEMMMNDKNEFFSFSNVINLASNPRFRKSGLNTADLFKISMAQSAAPLDEIKTEKIEQREFSPESYGRVDGTIYQLFKDTEIINKKISVEVINGTEINGLGNRVSRIFENWGFDVVSIISDSEQSNSKLIMHINDEKVQSDLSKVFPISYRIDQKKSIADITFIIAEDNLKDLNI